MTASQPDPTDAAAEKAALRKRALAARADLPPETRFAAAKAVAAAGAEIVARERPERVALFISVKGEIGTGPLAAKLVEMGAPLCLPVIVGKGEPLIFRDWKPGDPLEDKPFGLKEPPTAAPEVTPDLLFVPLAAFDAAGRRLGYGGGFYDRTLAKLRAAGRPAQAIGLAFAAQQVAAVPHDPWDERLEGVLTEAGFIPTVGA